MNLIAILISILSSIVSGTILFLLQKYFKSKEKRDVERENLKAKENFLILKSIDALGKLTYANAISIRDGKTNGEMHEAMDSYSVIKEELYDYLLEQNSKK